VIPDALGERADLLEDGTQGRHEPLGDVLFGPLVEAPGRTLGQPSSEGLDRSPNVVDQLRAATDQRLTGTDQGQVGLSVFAPVL
jgi:hypothetical protein